MFNPEEKYSQRTRPKFSEARILLAICQGRIVHISPKINYIHFLSLKENNKNG
jgi:hypothetical protein